MLLLVMLLGFGLRVYHLGAQELRGDETFGYFFSLQTYANIVRATLALREPHPVAGYFIEKLWLTLAGDSEFALRFVSAWWGALAVALLYRLGRRLGLGAGVSALAALLLAVSPYALWHSQDARMYTISLTLTLASTWLAFEAVQCRRWLYWIAYVAVTWLALQTHYFAFFVILAQNTYFICLGLLVWRRPARVLEWILAQLSLGLLVLPWLILARDTLTRYGGNGDSPAFGPMLIRSFSAFAVGETTPVEQQVVFAWLAGLLVAIGVARLVLTTPHRRRAAIFLLLYLFMPLLATWISALRRPIFDERYLIAAVPPFYLLLANSIKSLSARSRPTPKITALNRALAPVVASILIVVQAGALLSVGRYYATPTYSKTVGWRQLAASIDRLSAGLPPEQVRVAQNFPDPTLWYYYRGSVKHIVLPPKALDQEAARREVATIAEAGVRRVILPVQLAPWWDDRGIASEVLAGDYTRVAANTVGVWPVEVYVRPPEALGPMGGIFANKLVLEAATVEPSQVPAGGLLAVYLRWQGPPSMLPGGEKITIQVLDPSNQVVAQTDQPFTADQITNRITSYGILLPEKDLVPGDYRVILALYNPEQPGAPRLRTTQGADFVPLATVRIP